MTDKRYPELWGQFIRLIRSEFYKYDLDCSDITEEELPFAYLNWLRRVIPQKPRNILKSVEFECPEEHAEGFSEIEQKIRVGEDLRAHLSKDLVQLSWNDKMLNDWRIYHLHLGVGPHPHIAGLTKRTGPLLYARFDESNAYLIKIVPKHGLWTDKESVQIIHDNWPASIQQYRVSGSSYNGEGHSDKEHAQIRKHNGNILLRLKDGVTYMGIGGGLTKSGESTRTWGLHDYIMSSLEEFDTFYEREKGKSIPNNPSPKLAIVKDGYKLALAVLVLGLGPPIWYVEVDLS